jgi:hypothetical protein
VVLFFRLVFAGSRHCGDSAGREASPSAARRLQINEKLDAFLETHGATVATRNVKDFRHAKNFNPWVDEGNH